MCTVNFTLTFNVTLSFECRLNGYLHRISLELHKNQKLKKLHQNLMYLYFFNDFCQFTMFRFDVP